MMASQGIVEDVSRHLILPLVGDWEQPGSTGRSGLNRAQDVVRHEWDVKVVAADGACRRWMAQ